ncbi:uncharacterized protein [Physcomitrium patens]|uniref:Uncharacterized protein n=1 Tax=Physcomitrium patens TaxID=3218 RepID=A0A7I4CN29_PHYPA|nr:uncharacterized protein LOC112276538 isoform X1 [Physcomitrium patens]XP_024363714.1 uncharacterized protein LOC112276538 isoform X1 [Physcomitrium patens]|eukprot:XP_024363713.1 uncharacterized protein LOC112276538 isoform X1 [Physcomitrella patens]
MDQYWNGTPSCANVEVSSKKAPIAWHFYPKPSSIILRINQHPLSLEVYLPEEIFPSSSATNSSDSDSICGGASRSPSTVNKRSFDEDSDAESNYTADGEDSRRILSTCRCSRRSCESLYDRETRSISRGLAARRNIGHPAIEQHLLQFVNLLEGSDFGNAYFSHDLMQASHFPCSASTASVAVLSTNADHVLRL